MIADEREILTYFTDVMRGETGNAMKAAELLGKHYGLFNPEESGAKLPPPQIVADIP